MLRSGLVGDPWLFFLLDFVACCNLDIRKLGSLLLGVGVCDGGCTCSALRVMRGDSECRFCSLPTNRECL